MNAALGAVRGAVTETATLFATAITNAAIKIFSSDAVQGVKDFAYSMFVNEGGNTDGVVIDEKRGTMTQYSADGAKTEVKLDKNYANFDQIERK